MQIKKYCKQIFGVLLAVCTCLTFTMTAVGDEIGIQSIIEGDDLKIEKNLDKPKGTPTPNAVFEFVFEKVSYNFETSEANKLPDIGTPIGGGMSVVTIELNDTDGGLDDTTVTKNQIISLMEFISHIPVFIDTN